MRPHLDFEKKHWDLDRLVLGIDEVGRGAFAGPLVVGGTIFKKCCNNKEAENLMSFGINDSKLLSAKRRQNLYKIIRDFSLFTTTVFIPVVVINKIGVGHATEIAMRQVVHNALQFVGNFFVLTDAFEIPKLFDSGPSDAIALAGKQARMTGKVIGQLPIIHGDRLSISIAAASIIAKVERDNHMRKLALKYPEYGFEKHVGYGTKFHREALQKLGPSKIHRIDFIKKTIGI